MKKQLLSLLSILVYSTILSQDNTCSFRIENNTFHNDVVQHLSQMHLKNQAATVIVPVVFHIVYNSPIENVPDSLIVQQLDRLNRDFQKTNSDTINTPAPFKNMAGKMDIQFCFAAFTPSLVPTTGINRVFTTKTFFNAPSSYSILDSLKHTSLGGADSWDITKYLNIWIGNVTNVTGYSAPPGNMQNNEDGIGVNYKSLGTSNSALPYNKRRTVVHEAGHFFGLRHIWGDDGGACSGTDFMGDTPNQANFTPGNSFGNCPTFPRLDACTPASPGVMFMNYMDYDNDDCRNMFTNNQVSYMLATINCCRAQMLSNTLAQCNSATGITEINNRVYKIYPNPFTSNFVIETNESVSELKLKMFDVLGSEIKNNSVTINNGKISVSTINLATGIYFIEVCSDNKIITRSKIIKE
jgi:hypothetical protein